MRVTVALVTTSLALLMVFPALADDRIDCASFNSAIAIKGCSAVINSGRETKQNLAMAYYTRGIAYWNAVFIDDAFEDFNKVIALDPKHANAYNYRGEVYAWKDQHALAIADFDKAISLNQKNGKAYYNRAIELEKKNEWKRALTDWQAAIAYIPENDAFRAKARANLARAETAAVAYLNREIDNLAEEKAKRAEDNAKLAFIEAMTAPQQEIPDAPPLESMLTIGTQGSQLDFYHGGCGIPEECTVAVIKCDSKGSFEADLGPLEQDDIAVWFASTNGTATLTVDAQIFEFQVESIFFRDMDYSWGATIPFQSEKIWAALSTAKNISLTVGKHVTMLPHTKDVAELIKACGH